MSATDVLIAGAGPVGSALALLLVESGMEPDAIALVDARDTALAEHDSRLIALSESSRGLLERLGAWPSDGATPIHRIHVSHRGAFGRTRIERGDYGLEALGHVVRYGALTQAVNGATASRGVTVQRPVRLVDTRTEEDGVRVRFADSESRTARYVVHAEGGVYGQQDAQSIHRDYQQTAIAAFVTAAHPEPGTAWERFTKDGPLALLPAESEGVAGLALVWCCRPDDAQRRAGLDEAEFLCELHEAFGDRLGRFLSVGTRSTFALGLNARAEIAQFREFAIGNAAQTLHPVAGQGLNLGLRDAVVLAGLLTEHFDAPLTCVREFGAMRRLDRAATVNLTDLLPRLFASSLAPVAALRGVALAALDLVGPARHVLARQMMEGQR